MADKIVAVPGVGNVAFPDTMSDDDIAAQLQKQTTAPPAQAQPAGDPASRYFGNLWDKTAGGAVATAKTLFDLAKTGMTGNVNPTGPGAQFLNDTIQAHIDQGAKAKDAFSKGRYSEAAGHVLAAALPFIGPAAAAAGEQIGGTEAKFDKYGKVIEPGKAPDIAGGLGSTTALLAPMAAGPLIGKVAGKLGGVIDPALDARAQALARESLKGGYTTRTPVAEVNQAASTMRELGAPLTAEGSAKIEQALTQLRQSITDKVRDASQNGVTVDPNRALQPLLDTYDKYKLQVNSPRDLADINKVAKNFAADNPTAIPASRAQAMKVGSNALNAEKYGRVSTAQVEAEKALTRGLKEELEAQIPELSSLNAQQAKLMNLDNILGEAVNKYALSPGFVGDLKTTNISASALRYVLADPVLKARLAIAIDRVRKFNPGQFTSGVSGLAKINSLVTALTPQQSQQ